jgi:hypothetical protein
MANDITITSDAHADQVQLQVDEYNSWARDPQNNGAFDRTDRAIAAFDKKHALERYRAQRRAVPPPSADDLLARDQHDGKYDDAITARRARLASMDDGPAKVKLVEEIALLTNAKSPRDEPVPGAFSERDIDQGARALRWGGMARDGFKDAMQTLGASPVEARRLLFALEHATPEPGLSDTVLVNRFESWWGANWRRTYEAANRAWQTFNEAVPLDAYRGDRAVLERLAALDKGLC